MTEKQAKELSRRRRGESITLEDGTSYLNGAKVSAADSAAAAATTARNAQLDSETRTGQIGSNSSTPPSAAFKSTGDAVEDYAAQRARQLKIQNDAAAAPAEKAAAAKAREKEITGRQAATVEKAFRTRDAIASGKPMPAGVSFTQGGDSNQTIDNPDNQTITGAFKDGTTYSLKGKTRAERMADAKKQNIYDRLIDENPGAYPEWEQRQKEQQIAAQRNGTADTSGTFRTLGGGVVGGDMSKGGYLPNGLPAKGYEGSALAKMTNAQLSAYFKANPTQANADFIPNYTPPAPVAATPAKPAAPSAPAATASAPVITNADSPAAPFNQQAQLAAAANLRAAGVKTLAPDQITGGQSTNPATRTGAPVDSFRNRHIPSLTPPPTQQQVAAAILAPAPAPLITAAPPAAAPSITPAPLAPAVAPTAAFATQPAAPSFTPAAPLSPVTASLAPDPSAVAAFRSQAAAAGTPLVSSPTTPSPATDGSLAARRKPPLIASFKSNGSYA